MTPERQTNDSKRRQERKTNRDHEWKKNPKQEYLSARSENITEKHCKQEERWIDRFELFLSQSDEIPDDIGIRDVVKEDVIKYLRQNLDPDPRLSDNTVEDHLKVLSYFYRTLDAHNVIDGNPVYEPDREEGSKGALSVVRNSDDYDLEDSERPHVPKERMVAFLDWIDSPKIRAMHLVGSKAAARTGSVVNLDLRCLNIAHPIFDAVIQEHGITPDPRIENKPDSLLIYQEFNSGTEIPNEDRPGPDKGEVREGGCKRKEKNGSIIPIDSELKTALIKWLLCRPPTFNRNIHPVFVSGRSNPNRIAMDDYINEEWSDTVRTFGDEERLDKCPSCGGEVVKKNLKQITPGRHYTCQNCGEVHWRSIMWEPKKNTAQKFTFHCNRHFFSDGVRKGKSEITEKEMDDIVRQYKIRGDVVKDQDADTGHYDHPHNLDWEKDIRKHYLESIFKFGLYNEVIPAVGEGWNQ